LPDQDEFRVTLSLAQMAAILESESLTPYEIFSNRVIGSLRLVGGIIELGGAGVLCAIPEPTMISKAGCIAMGIHASDQLAAGAHQLVTAKETDSYAFKAGMTAAEVMGASRATGQVVGLAAEFAVPLSTASLYNAFRVSSVRAGRMTIAAGNQFQHAPRKGPGGHVIRDHLDKGLVAVQKRLKKVRGTDAISVFTNLDVAEWAVSQVLKSNKYRIAINSKMSLFRKNKRLSMRMDLGTTVGWGVTRAASETPVYMHKVVVVIEFAEYNHMPAYVVTAYPVL
jgi:hypothetical protein